MTSSANASPFSGDERFLTALGAMDPVPLDELNRDAGLLTRHDRKYVVSTDQAAELAEAFVEECRALEIDGRRCFDYETTYYDTPDRRMYRDAAHRRPKRSKVRVRRYVDSDASMLEVKVKDARGRTVKHRTATESPQMAPLTFDMREMVDAHSSPAPFGPLDPVVQTSFSRSTLLTRSGDVRCTIDHELSSTASDGRLVAPHLVVVETKSLGQNSQIDRWLWANSIRPVGISKYSTAMAAFDSTLPSNRWHRVLARYFAGAVQESRSA